MKAISRTMNWTRFRRTLAPIALVAFWSITSARAEDAGRMLFDFNKPDAGNSWYTVNDGVMGGVSEGKVRITREKTLEFFGDLSLENNGGFASVRTRPGKLNLTEYEAFVFKARGDGRPYYFNVHVPTRRIAFSYRAEFATEKGQWQTIRIPFQDFVATSFGQKLSGAAPLDPSNIESIGFLLADKKAGPFKLEVVWIKVVAE